MELKLKTKQFCHTVGIGFHKASLSIKELNIYTKKYVIFYEKERDSERGRSPMSKSSLTIISNTEKDSRRCVPQGSVLEPFFFITSSN